jgi:hypothetical protein
MGYMGLDNHLYSDFAADLARDMQKSMAKVLRKGLKEKGNHLNTNGIVNVAMMFEDFIFPCVYFYAFSDELVSLARETHKRLDKMIEKDGVRDWDNAQNRAEHLFAYKRLRKTLTRFINAAG